MNAQNQKVEINQLSHRTEVAVRFSEVDALGIVWHGHYVKFFEDGREDFGKKYGLGYLEIYKQGFAAPIVKLTVEYKKTVKYGESVIVETTFINNPASKIIFNYKVFRASDNELVATGESTQVFLTTDHELYITTPDFFDLWKKKNLLK